MKWLLSVPLIFALLVVLTGCGSGGGEPSAGLPGPDAPARSSEVGPFVIHTAAAATVTLETLPNQSGATFTAVHGGPIDYIAVEELLDRIVFSSFRTAANWDIWVCDLFGENLQKINGTGWPDRYPAWSPDGEKIAFGQERDGDGEADVWVVDADGSNLTNLTNSAHYDTHPTWSPSGGRIAFQTDRWATNNEIAVMYADGTGVVNISNTPTHSDHEPDWSPNRIMGGIVFGTSRHGNMELYTMSPDGSNQSRVTDIVPHATDPAWSPEGYYIAFTSYLTATGSDVLEVTAAGDDRGPIADTSHYEDEASYSHDGRFVAYCSAEGGGFNIWVRPIDPPGPPVRVTDGGGSDGCPDLGSPTVQTARVLIGPSGSDHGHNPVHEHAIATVLVHDYRGYVNFVRLGIKTSGLGSLQVTPLEGTGSGLVGVVWSATDMYYVEQDAGLGQEPTLWDMPGTSRSIALYLNSETGKLVSILDLDDDIATVSSVAAGDALTHEVKAASTTVHGSFRAVYGTDGELVAEGEIGAVEIDASQGVVRVF